LAAVLATAAPFAQASLTAYSSDGKALVGVGTGPSPSTYDFTMTASGNLLSDSTLRSAIRAANSSLTDGDFDSFGRATYRGALAFISYLNSTSYGGTQQWRLPAMLQSGACNFTYDGTNCGYNVNPATSELARVYYTELGRIAKFDADAFPNEGYGIFKDGGYETPPSPVLPLPFTNVQSDAYWLGLTYSLNDAQAWSFATSDGNQGFESKAGQRFVWAVAPGNVQITTSPVPLPAPVWLIGSGLACLAFRLRRARPA
jgi:hypothetical protein